MSFTILGSSGFIGSHIARWLDAQSIPYWVPSRDESVFDRPLGHVIYCIGLTADFRERTYDTVQAHVCNLLPILEQAEFTSFLYLSTTRLYSRGETAHEESILQVNPLDPSDLYNISKAMGESLCLTVARPDIRVARLSNVYGNDFASANFLSSVVRDAIERQRVVLRSSMASAKDYISINDVVRLLPRIALSGRHRIYNIASGMNTTNGVLLEVIQRETGCIAEVAEGSETIIFPPISVDRIREEFGFAPATVHQELSGLIAAYRQEVGNR